MDAYLDRTEFEKKLKELEISVVDGWKEDTYDVYIGKERVLTDAPEVQASSFMMKHQRKIEALIRQNQRSIDYVQRWKNYSESASNAKK